MIINCVTCLTFPISTFLLYRIIFIYTVNLSFWIKMLLHWIVFNLMWKISVKYHRWKVKGNGSVYILYIALIFVVHARRSGMDHTVIPAILQQHCLPLPRKRSPGGSSSDWGCGHLIAAYYSFIYPQKDGWLSQPGWMTYSGQFNHIADAADVQK